MAWNWQRSALKAGLGLSAGFRRRLVGDAPVNDRGHALDDDLWWMLALEKRLAVSLGGGDVQSARRGMLEGVRVVEGEARPAVSASDQTIGGFIMTTLGRVPDKGDELRLENIVFSVSQMDGRRVLEVSVRLEEVAK